MKIYATTSSSDLSSFLGKDIWVKCWCVPPGCVDSEDDPFVPEQDGELGYARFIEVRTGGSFPDYQYELVVYNWIPENDMRHLAELDDRDVRFLLTVRKKQFPRGFTIVTPLDVIPTSELPVITSEGIDKFDQFIGKELWIKVSAYGGFPKYIRPLARDEYYLRYNKVDSGYVDYNYAIEPDGIDYFLKVQHESHVDTLTILKPLEILTTDEILDILENNPIDNEEDDWEGDD